jgi:hypothetical protein
MSAIANSQINTRTALPGLPARPTCLTTNISLGDAFCVLVPLLQFVRFNLIGEMCLSDFLITMALPLAVWRHSERLRQKPVSAILSLGLLWLISQIITDLLRGSAPEDYLRGWSKILLLLANFAVVWIVACRSWRRFVLYGVGLAVGLILQFYLSPSAETQMAPWKFALGVPVTLLAMTVISFAAKGNFLGIILPVTALTVLHAFEDVRSLAVVTFLAAIFTVFHLSSSKVQRGFRIARLGFLTIVIACGLWGFMQVYSYYAERGLFGEYAQRKLAAQTSGTGGLLLGGRSEILGSGQAILDSPLLGHGSWPRDPIYSAILDERRKELGFRDVEQNSGPRDDLIPTHSYVFGAWVEAGLGGALFWLFFLRFTIRTFLHVSGSEPFLLLFAFGGFLMVWDTFFSPLGMPTRFVAPFLMAAIVLLSTLGGTSEEIW